MVLIAYIAAAVLPGLWIAAFFYRRHASAATRRAVERERRKYGTWYKRQEWYWESAASVEDWDRKFDTYNP